MCCALTLPLVSTNFCPGTGKARCTSFAASHLPDQRRTANSSSNKRSARWCPASVSTTDLALPTGSEISPLMCKPVYRLPIEAFPHPTAVVQPEHQQCQNRIVDPIGADIESHVHRPATARRPP